MAKQKKFLYVKRTWLQPRLVALALCLSVTSFSLGHAAPVGWNQTWNDEFEGTTVDTNKWDPILWTTPHNNEQQAYHPSRVTVSEGNLVLTADGANFGGKSYTSGKVESLFAQQYGRWEIRAKLPGTLGTWPAIWLLPDTNAYPWPSQGEIDIMENRGNQPNLTSSAYHYGANFQSRQFKVEEQEATNGGQAENYHDDFHVYAVEWDASKLRFFVDDVMYHSISNAETGGFLGNQTAPVEINLNVAVGGSFLGNAQPDSSSVWPQQMLVDYVRVYERDASPPPVVFRNGSFEEQGGSLAGWSTLGNKIPNIQTHHEAAAIDGNETLKLFGQFTGSLNISRVEQGISVSPGDSIAASASALIRSADDLTGSNTVEMKFDYYSDFGGKLGSSSYLGSSSTILVANASTANNLWLAHELTATAPAGAVEARLAILFRQPGSNGGAIHIDNVSFTNLDLDFNADADNDGDVDGADFLSWQRGFGQNEGVGVSEGDFNYDGTVDAGDLAIWVEKFDGLATATTNIVPEPSTQTLLALAIFFFFKR